MMNSRELLKILQSEHDVSDGTSDYSNTITTGIVVDTDDPLQTGRLRVFCPNLNDDPKKILHLPWAVYCPPFGGVVSNSAYARGAGKGPETTEGAVAYGFWGIPEQGAKVIVACLDGDERRRVWMGCLHEHQETHTLFHGRYKWEGEDGEPDGPLSSKGNPIEPLYTNAGKAFNDERDSREWKTRQAEYQVTAILPDEDAPNEEKSEYLDELYPEISSEETDEWVKPILGAHGYDWSGNKALGAHLASRVFGMSSPGGHNISMDDRAFNSRLKIKSATGHQLIFDDTNERIYLSTNEGANWIEFDTNGNIDIYSKRRISVHAEKDINFSTDESFRVKAKKGIYMYSGDTRGQTPLEENPGVGEIRMHSTGDIHQLSEKNIRIKCTDDFNLEVTSGDVNINVQGDWNLVSLSDVNIFSDDNKVLISNSNSQLVLDAGDVTYKATNFFADMDNSLRLQGGASIVEIGPAGNKLFTTGVNLLQDAGGSLATSPTVLIAAIEACCGTPPIAPGTPPAPVTFSFDIQVPVESGTNFAPWTNRVPEHEPWPRVLKQDSDDEENKENDGYIDNVDWIDQYDNESTPEGLEDIGKVEGDETIERGPLWRR